MERDEIILTSHAAARMAERQIDVLAVIAVVTAGEVIAVQSERVPVSRTQLGWYHGRPLHVVTAREGHQTIVITVYEPNPALWTADFRERIK